MSEHTTSRRAVLAGAAGVAAAGAFSTAAMALPTIRGSSYPSPELLAWRKARAACRLVWEATSNDPEDVRLARSLKNWKRRREPDWEIFKSIVADPADCSPTIRAIATAEVREDTARAALLHRPVHSFRDIADRLEVLRAQRVWQEGRETYERYIACPELDALFAAIDTLAKGGVNGSV